MGDQDQGNTMAPPGSLPKRVSDIPGATGIEEVKVGKTRIELDEFFGMGRDRGVRPITGTIIRTPEQEEEHRQEIEKEVAERVAQRQEMAEWLAKLAMPDEVLEELEEEEAEEFATDVLVNNVLEELVRRLLPDHLEIVDRRADLKRRQSTAYRQAAYEQARAIFQKFWEDKAAERAEKAAKNPRQHCVQGSEFTLQIPVEDEEETE